MNRPEREGFVPDEPVDISDRPPPRALQPATPAEPEATEPAPPRPGPEWPLVYKLKYKPLQISKTETAEELSFREPSTNDIIRAGGNPCRVDVRQLSNNMIEFYIHIDDGKMLAMMGQICATDSVMEPHLRKLDTRDYNNIAHQLRRFFRPDWDSINW